MNNLFSNIKRMLIEPKVYALIVSSSKGQTLHLGVHFSLEEAYSVARRKLEQIAVHDPGEAVDIELWTSSSARQISMTINGADSVQKDNIDDHKSSVKEFSSNDQQDSVIPQSVFAENDLDKIPEEIKQIIRNITISNSNPKNLFLETNDDAMVENPKNDLMKKLIAEGSMFQVNKNKGMLDESSLQYVKSAIRDKKRLKIKRSKGIL